MKNYFLNLLCFVIMCAMCILPIPAFASETYISNLFDAGEHAEVEPYVMPISELIPTAEGTLQPNTINI